MESQIKLWNSISNENIDKSKSILNYELEKKSKLISKNVFISFFEKMLVYYQDSKCEKIKNILIYDFDLKVEWLYKDENYGNESKLLGFQLFKNKEKHVLSFYSSDISCLKNIKGFLKKKINQAGFHEYFKAIKKIGKGNFASVYLVEDKKNSDVRFAVKAFCKEAAYNADNGKEAVINEIEIMRELNNPYLIKLFEVFETDNSIYMGGNLLEHLKIKKTFSEEESEFIIKQMLQGLVHMKEKNIMHRDIKPENILFREKGSYLACLVDFGLATKINLKKYLFVRCGTPGYVAPEIANNKKNILYDEKCDIFSLGVILHALLLGTVIFKGNNYSEVLELNKVCEIDFKNPIYKKISEEALDLLKCMLEKFPENRISAKEALNHKFFKNNKEFENENENLTPEDNDNDVADKLNNINLKSIDMKKKSNPNLFNSPISPLLKRAKMNQIENLSIQNPNIGILVCRNPLMTGTTKTVENFLKESQINSIEILAEKIDINRNKSRTVSEYYKKSLEKDVESPLLKKSLLSSYIPSRLSESKKIEKDISDFEKN